jgi:hypothetical protein
MALVETGNKISEENVLCDKKCMIGFTKNRASETL